MRYHENVNCTVPWVRLAGRAFVPQLHGMSGLTRISWLTFARQSGSFALSCHHGTFPMGKEVHVFAVLVDVQTKGVVSVTTAATCRRRTIHPEPVVRNALVKLRSSAGEWKRERGWSSGNELTNKMNAPRQNRAIR